MVIIKLMSATENFFYNITLLAVIASLIHVGLRIATSRTNHLVLVPQKTRHGDTLYTYMSVKKLQCNVLWGAIFAIFAAVFAHYVALLCLRMILGFSSQFIIAKIILGVLFFYIPFKIRSTACKSLETRMKNLKLCD